MFAGARTIDTASRMLDMASLFGPLPIAGPWTALGLRRGQFLGILAFSVGLFVVVGGPIWNHLHDGHTWRLGVSYSAIPPAVVCALQCNRSLRFGRALVASGVLALLKLVVTAGLMVLIALWAQ
jgi:hypothetical protein